MAGTEAKEEKHKVALGELLRLADNISRSVISAYDPNVSHKANQALIGGRKFSSDTLEVCAVFLKLKTRNNKEKIYSNKMTLADRIILKIESYFEAECKECLEKYTNRVNATTDNAPIFSCFLCMQGSHDCDAIKEIHTAMSAVPAITDASSGIVWLCKGCFEKNNLLTSTAKNKSGNDKERTEKPSEEGDEETDEKDEEVEVQVKDTNETENSGAGTSHNNNKVCKLYMQMKCPHGLTGKREIAGERCKDNHPPRCHRFCRYGAKHKLGCNKSKSCKYYHPTICRHSLKDRRCTNLDCTYTHLKGTQRFDSQPQDEEYRTTHPKRSRRESYNRDDRIHSENRKRTSSNASVIQPQDYVGSRKRTFSNASTTNQDYRPRTPSTTSHQLPSGILKNSENDFLERRFRLMEVQLEEIKRLLRPPLPQPWNPMITDNQFMMLPQQQPQIPTNVSHPPPNLWNQPLQQFHNNINSVC